MKVLLAACAVAAVTVGLQADAFAQSKKQRVQSAPVYRYCLLEAGGHYGGGGAMWCRYHTWEQCWASKAGWTDSCILNPELTLRRR